MATDTIYLRLSADSGEKIRKAAAASGLSLCSFCEQALLFAIGKDLAPKLKKAVTAASPPAKLEKYGPEYWEAMRKMVKSQG